MTPYGVTIPQYNQPINLGLYSLRRRRLTGIGIPILNLRRSDDRLRFIMGIPILIRRRLLSEQRPRYCCSYCPRGQQVLIGDAEIGLRSLRVRRCSLTSLAISLARCRARQYDVNSITPRGAHTSTGGCENKKNQLRLEVTLHRATEFVINLISFKIYVNVVLTDDNFQIGLTVIKEAYVTNI